MCIVSISHPIDPLLGAAKYISDIFTFLAQFRDFHVFFKQPFHPRVHVLLSVDAVSWVLDDQHVHVESLLNPIENRARLPGVLGVAMEVDNYVLAWFVQWKENTRDGTILVLISLDAVKVNVDSWNVDQVRVAFIVARFFRCLEYQ
jgi:hypothetical protein